MGRTPLEMGRSELVRTAALLGCAMILFFGLLMPLIRKHPFPLWPWVVGMLLPVAAAVSPSVVRPVLGWLLYAAEKIGRLNGMVLLAAVYFLVISPVGLVMRILGYDPLNRKFLPSAESYRVVSPGESGGRMERPY